MTGKCTPKSKQASAPKGQTVALFGDEPPGYVALHAEISGSINPADPIEKILVEDFVLSQLEVSHVRRGASNQRKARQLAALEYDLRPLLDDDLYAEEFADSLSDLLFESPPEQRRNDAAKELALRFARGDDAALEKVRSLFSIALSSTAGESMLDIADRRARTKKAKKLSQFYQRGEPEAVKLVNELLGSVGRTVDSVFGEELVKNLEITSASIA